MRFIPHITGKAIARSMMHSTVSIPNMSIDQWTEAFKEQTIDVARMDVDNVSYEESANRLRSLIKTGLLRHTDLLHCPERFFLAHRLLAQHSPSLGPGFWIRFTVHYNLCAGTVLGLGNDEQIASLDQMQENGELGCFSLTEKFAGVNSGMIVNTVAEWDGATEEFVLNSPHKGAHKNWISQGLVADKTVVVADLRMNGKSFGPHAFLTDLRKKGELVPGVTLGDMGPKTVGNDLDNAWIAFEELRVPRSALLNRYADIVKGDSGEHEYVQKIDNMPVFHMIGQRLFTGRVAVAQAALEFRRELFRTTKKYTDEKLCWSPRGEGSVPLSDIPQLRQLYTEAEDVCGQVENFVKACEEDLCATLRSNSVPSVKLVEAIAVAKVKAVEEAITYTHQLKNEVGSYALMKQTGFGQTDFLQCCKFAEGDSRILMQKMARDRMKVFSASPEASVTGCDPRWDRETQLCHALQGAMQDDISSARALNKHDAWDLRWEEVYQLADAVMERIINEYMSGRN